MNNEIEQTTEVSFVDKNRERFNCKIEITYRNKYKQLSICSDNGQHKFVPANEAQEKLLNIWNTYHLNGMNAGTPKQEEALKKWKEAGNKYDYEKAVEYLQCLDPNGNPLSALAVKEINSERAIVQPKIDFWKNKTKEFKEALEKYEKGRGHGEGWFVFDFDSIEFEHEKVKDIQNSKRVWFDYKYGVINFKKIVERHLEKKLKEAQDVIDKINLKSLHYDNYEESAYQYGTAWITKSLPEDIDEQIESIVQEIEEAEEERKGEPLTKLSDSDLVALIEEKTSFEGRDAKLAAAFVKMFDLSENDFDDIEIDGTRCSVQGTDYTAGNDEECDEAATEEIKESLWAFNASFLAEQTDLDEEVFSALQHQCESANKAILSLVKSNCGLEEFVEAAISADTRGHFLNRYDGGEETATVEGEEFFAYRNS